MDFTLKCRSQLMRQQKRRLGDWKLDFNLRTTCEADVEAHCRVRHIVVQDIATCVSQVFVEESLGRRILFAGRRTLRELFVPSPCFLIDGSHLSARLVYDTAVITTCEVDAEYVTLFVTFQGYHVRVGPPRHSEGFHGAHLLVEQEASGDDEKKPGSVMRCLTESIGDTHVSCAEETVRAVHSALQFYQPV